MHKTSGVDVLAGMLTTGLGLGVSGYAFAKFPSSGLSDVGPGLFPLLVGILLTFCGLAMSVQGARNGARALQLTWRRAAVIVLSVFCFIGVVKWFGLVPAICVLVLISSLASAQYIGFLKSCIVAVFMCMFVYFTFTLGLGQHVDYLKLGAF